jgi:murein DD-endopeptidase MepM/ murein hydrolase activator NlpD
VKVDKKTLEEKLKGYRSQMQDNEVKLAVYKSFQVIYENYLYGYKKENYQFKVKENFKFVDRAYNDISTQAVLDIKTLISDSQDTNVSLFSSISRLLSNNNFWFYPFQGFLTDTKGYNDLFRIDISQKITTKPLFIAMYVGGLSSNPSGPSNSTISDDGIKKNSIPPDFSKDGKTLSAFLVKYTGIQNQIVFSNFEHSTESLKNTDEGLRIQSEVISNASNSLAIPKGQSLLNVYQKQSYTSTVKIPYGNMGIQPTQYYYLEFMPIFEGLYIVYNVTHNINSDTQRLETTFKGYRLKKDVNPIVTQEIVDFIRNNFYTQTLEKVGIPSSITNLTPQQIAAIESATTRNDKVSGFKVTSTYLRKNGIVHGAIDIGTTNGTALKFTLPNTTFVRKKEDKNGYGYYIVLKNNKENKYFYFAHLQEFSPYINNLKGEEATNPDTIDITQLLGKTGDTGRARTLGPGQDGESLDSHLHFEVRDSDNRYRLDYNPYLKYLVLGA